MIMRLPDIGSRYLMAFSDADNNDLDGGKTYKVTLPPNIPQGKFWSFTLYDNQTRSMLETPQRSPERAARDIRRRPPSRIRTDRSTSGSGPRLPRAKSATGSRRCRARAST
jgi:hypothetical protein